MIYSAEVTILTTHSVTAPKHQFIQVTKGLVYKVEIQFPPGCAGLAHVAIMDGSQSCWPSTPGQTFNLDAYTICFDDTYLKLAEPYQFEVWGYNEDTLWPHTIHIRIGMVSKDIFMARFLPTYAYEHYQKLLKEEEQRQLELAAKVLEKPFPWLV